MKIATFNSMEWSKKYNILTSYLNNSLNLSGPSSTSWLRIPPKSISTPHCHHEIECLFIFKGQGKLHLEGEVLILEEGTTITIMPFETHSLENTHIENDLVILSHVIDDIAKLFPTLQIKNQLPHQKYLIISTPPTPNGDLHLGHLAGPYLKADVLKRFLTLNHKTVYHLTGQDSNQSYTKRRAEILERKPHDLADYFGNEIKSTLIKSDIKLDYFTNPRTSIDYQVNLQSILLQLWHAGKIIVKETQGLVCETCDLYLYEVYVRGLCPHCSTETGGNFCEACGHSNDCIDMLEPKCSICKTTPIKKVMRRAYFPLTPYLDELREYHKNTINDKILQELCDSFIKTGLKDAPVSHPSNWGIPCPIPGLEDQIISVWFEMGIGHLASTTAFIKEKYPENINNELEFWTTHSATVLYTFGFDNSFFNCILFPCTFLAIDKKLNLPSGLYFNQFYCLEGLKFSTSRNHLIWAKDFLKHHSSDIMRFYLCYTSPEITQSSFEQSAFDLFSNEINNKLIACLILIAQALNKQFNNRVPYTGLWLPEHIKFYQYLLQSINDLSRFYHPETFSLRSAAGSLYDFLQHITMFIQANIEIQSISPPSDEYRTSMALGLLALKIFSTCAHPIMPRTSAQLASNLGYPETQKWDALLDWVPYQQLIFSLIKDINLIL